MNKIFKKLLLSKSNSFLKDFDDLSREVFVDKNGKLLNSLEFGLYREKIVAELLSSVMPSRFSIGSGFIITSKNRISTQCDLIIYDNRNTPIIKNNGQRFFPIECVAAVIEVKSNLSKTEFKKSLIKLANIKKIRKDVNTNLLEYKSNLRCPISKFNFKKNFCDQIGTILICESINGINYNNLEGEFNKIYQNVDKSFLHNLVLSTKNGLFSYSMKDKSLPSGTIYPFYFPYINYKEPFKNLFISFENKRDRNELIVSFLHYFYEIIRTVSILRIDLTQYLGVNSLLVGYEDDV